MLEWEAPRSGSVEVGSLLRQELASSYDRIHRLAIHSLLCLQSSVAITDSFLAGRMLLGMMPIGLDRRNFSGGSLLCFLLLLLRPKKGRFLAARDFLMRVWEPHGMSY